MKRRKMTLDEVRKESTYFASTGDMTVGIMALVEVESMGWCRDGVTRWYHFTDESGSPAVYYKY